MLLQVYPSTLQWFIEIPVWICKMWYIMVLSKCIGEFFAFNHIDDECIFLRMISEISVSCDIIVRYHSACKIFNPFKINEDDSNILEYQGDFYTNIPIAYWKHATTKLRKLLITMQVGKVFPTTTFLYSTARLEVYHLILPHCYLTCTILTTGFRWLNLLKHGWIHLTLMHMAYIDGYTHVGITSSNQHDGGVSLFMSNEISSYSELTEFAKVQEYIECLFLKINFRDITSI